MKLAIIIIVCLLTAVDTSVAQQIKGGSNYFQEVIITYNSEDYCFYRESTDCIHWCDWISKPVFDHTKPAQSYRPQSVHQDVVYTIMGPGLIGWLENRPHTSGYYNFTNKKQYDWKKFGGDRYGTWIKKRITFRIYPK